MLTEEEVEAHLQTLASVNFYMVINTLGDRLVVGNFETHEDQLHNVKAVVLVNTC